MEYRCDCLIVGAGLTGIVLAERLASLGKKIIIVEKRKHIGGNCYDFFDEKGNYIQKYGPHIFHTDNRKVWNYLSRFTKWNSYIHKVYVNIDGNLINIPFNLNSIDLAFSKNEAETIKCALIEKVGKNKKIPILELRHIDHPLLKKLSEYIYNNIYHGYTIKQWGLTPDEIDTSVTARVPIFVSKDDRYFQNLYQGIPKDGFTKLLKNMVMSKNIKIIFGKDYKDLNIEYQKMYYTGPLDYFYDYKHGKILYRKLRLNLKKYAVDSYQSNSVINYPNNYKFTRITEFNKLLLKRNNSSVVAREYASWENGFLAYPVQSSKNSKIISKYKQEESKQNNVIFVGRLAECRYFNMDEVVQRAMEIIR